MVKMRVMDPLKSTTAVQQAHGNTVAVAASDLNRWRNMRRQHLGEIPTNPLGLNQCTLQQLGRRF